MKTQPLLGKAICLCTFALLLATASHGLPIIKAGVDVWQTLDDGGTVYSFAADPLPAGFFCPGSAPFTGDIKLQGVPLDTWPAGVAGASDTIIERLNDIDLSGGSASARIVVRAMSLEGIEVLAIQCEDGIQYFSVQACTCDTQPITKIRVRLDDPGCGCGTFSGNLDLNVCLTFTNLQTGAVLGPVSRPVRLGINGMSWCEKAGPGSVNIQEPFRVAAKCSLDYLATPIAVPGTSNFHPGWDCASVSSGLDCLDEFAHLTTCHSSFGTAPHDHCINPVCCPRQDGPCPK